MPSISTGNSTLDTVLGGGLPQGQITSIYSSTGSAWFRRRLLCSIAEANQALFVEGTANTVVPKTVTVFESDVRKTISAVLAPDSKYQVIVVDPVEFEIKLRDGENPASIRAMTIQSLMGIWYNSCFSNGKTLVLGWNRSHRMPVGGKFSSACILHVRDELIGVEKMRHGSAQGKVVQVNDLWAPSISFKSTATRFDIDLDLDGE